MTQADLARRTGVARKSISELESAKTRPEMDLVLRVLGSLGLALEVKGAATGTPKRSVDLDVVLEDHRRR